MSKSHGLFSKKRKKKSQNMIPNILDVVTTFKLEKSEKIPNGIRLQYKSIHADFEDHYISFDIQVGANYLEPKNRDALKRVVTDEISRNLFGTYLEAFYKRAKEEKEARLNAQLNALKAREELGI